MAAVEMVNKSMSQGELRCESHVCRHKSISLPAAAAAALAALQNYCVADQRPHFAIMKYTHTHPSLPAGMCVANLPALIADWPLKNATPIGN
jgi:hypothetical protein